MANCVNWFVRIFRWISLGCFVVVGLLDRLLLDRELSFFVFNIHVPIQFSKYFFLHFSFILFFSIFFLKIFILLFWQRQKQFVYITKRVVLLTYLCRWPGTCVWPLSPFIRPPPPPLPRPLPPPLECCVEKSFFLSFPPPLAKNKSRQKAQDGGDEDKTLNTKIKGNRRRNDLFIGFKTFQNGSFPPKLLTFFQLPLLPHCFSSSSFPVFCCCLWHTFARPANQMGHFEWGMQLNAIRTAFNTSEIYEKYIQRFTILIILILYGFS